LFAFTSPRLALGLGRVPDHERLGGDVRGDAFEAFGALGRFTPVAGGAPDVLTPHVPV
jgi:hypothetical protein